MLRWRLDKFRYLKVNLLSDLISIKVKRCVTDDMSKLTLLGYKERKKYFYYL